MESATYRATLDEGRKEGRKEGQLEQLRETVFRLLGRRLSKAVPEELVEQIRAAGRLALDAVSLCLVDVALSDRELQERIARHLEAGRPEAEENRAS